MNERNRYRVTGSVFLIAVAVIFLPMIFDGAGAPIRDAPPVPTRVNVAPVLQDIDDVVPATDVVKRVEELRQEVDDEGFATATGTRFGEPVLLPLRDRTTIWAVQAASFANHDNALAFRSKLRAGGYEAFISSVQDSSSESGKMHKVAVGPLLSQEDARAMQQAIGEIFAVQPVLTEMTQ